MFKGGPDTRRTLHNIEKGTYLAYNYKPSLPTNGKHGVIPTVNNFYIIHCLLESAHGTG